MTTVGTAGASVSLNDLDVSGTAAISQIFRVIEEQSQATFDEEFNFISYYNWTGGADSLSPPVNNYGNAEPKAYTGMVGTHHRPSDDLSTFGAQLINYCNSRDRVHIGI